MYGGENKKEVFALAKKKFYYRKVKGKKTKVRCKMPRKKRRKKRKR
jgi:hypothetical protein